jgi:Tol biopolymer transport system component
MRRNHLSRLYAAFMMTMLMVGTLHVSAQDSTPEANPPSNRIAYLEGGEYRASVFVHDLDTGTQQDLLGSSYYADYLTAVTDGRLAFLWSGELYLWDGTTAANINPPDSLQISSLVGSADGRLAFVLKERDAIYSNEFNLYVWENGAYRRLGSVPRSAIVTWSADGRLAFESNRDGNDEIYVWDGDTLTNVSSSTSADARPTWSADGRLAYVSSRDGAAEIYVWDGTTTINVSQSDAWDEYPIWSPDGRLAFLSSSNGNRTLFVWDGNTLTDLGQADGHFLTWSADGHLAFTSFRDGNREIYVWANGVSTNISQSAGEDWQPTWSIDGRLTFTTYHDNLRELFVWDGSLTSIGQWNRVSDFAWNIDGRLAFSADGEIFVWDGSTATNITNTPDQNEFNPYWLP